MQQLSIGAIAQLTQIPAHTLRKWESRHGIAVPMRSDTGRRVYTQDHVEQLRLIKLLVDRGHALPHLAALDTEQLRELADLHNQPLAKPEIHSLGLVGPTVCWLLSGDRLVRQRHPGDLHSWQRHSAYGTVEALVIESDTLTPAMIATLAEVKPDYKCLIVVYRHATRRTIALLTELGVIAIKGPAADKDLITQLQPAAVEAQYQRSPKRFSNKELGRIAALTPGLQCECPNHIAKLLMDITSFEQYSNECLDSDPAERALHQKLSEISAQARALFEDALVVVATADGLTLQDNTANTKE